MAGWNTIVSFWGPAYFQGLLLLVSGEGTLPQKKHCELSRFFRTWHKFKLKGMVTCNCQVIQVIFYRVLKGGVSKGRG